MLEPELKLAPPSDSNRLIPKIVIAGIVMIVVGAAVYLLNPRKTAEIAVEKTEVFAPHTVFNETPSSSKIIGTTPETEDDVYVVATVRIDDKLRLPLFLASTSATMMTQAGSVAATVISAADLPRLEETFPQIEQMVNSAKATPLKFDDAIAQGTSRVGTVVLLFPQVSEKDWRGRKSATLTVQFAHDAAPIAVSIP
jgi:hypothetical protein